MQIVLVYLKPLRRNLLLKSVKMCILKGLGLLKSTYVLQPEIAKNH